MTTAWGINRKVDLIRFLTLTRKLKRGPGFFLKLAKAFPKDRYQ